MARTDSPGGRKTSHVPRTELYVPLESRARLEAPDQEVRKGADLLAEEVRSLPVRARFSYRRLYSAADVEVRLVMVLPGWAGSCS